MTRRRSAPFAAILALALLFMACGGGAGHTVVLIALDGFRWDYLDRPVAVNLRALAERGVRAERLIPSFPSKTYPNHYTLVTGLYPQNHGIVANVIHDSALGWFRTGADPAVRDGRWFGGEPIWVTAEKRGIRTAVYFWPATEAEIGGVRPTWYVGYHKAISREARVNRVLDWLAMPKSERPRFITAYFEDTDNAGHEFGPTAARTDSAIATVDSAIGAIVKGIERLGRTNDVHVVVVSDHGMAETAPARTIYLDDLVSLDSLRVIDWTPVATIEPAAGRDAYVYSRLHGAHPNLAVYRKADVPARLHFSAGHRISPIVAIADEGWTISTRARIAALKGRSSQGAHGYDNALPSMSGILVAAGPGLRSGFVRPPLENVHVYPLLAALLGITPAASDGSIDSVRMMIRP
jgi:predicted AlkP superfamily pyrophosphatase or phosphodiesterase